MNKTFHLGSIPTERLITVLLQKDSSVWSRFSNVRKNEVSDQQLCGKSDISLLCLANKRRFCSARRVPTATHSTNKEANRTVGQQRQHNFQPSHVAPTRSWLHSFFPQLLEFALPLNLLWLVFFSCLKKKTTATTTHRLLFLHLLVVRLLLPFSPTTFSSSSCLSLQCLSLFFLCFMLIFFSSPLPQPPQRLGLFTLSFLYLGSVQL